MPLMLLHVNPLKLREHPLHRPPLHTTRFRAPAADLVQLPAIVPLQFLRILRMRYLEELEPFVQSPFRGFPGIQQQLVDRAV